MRVNDFYRDKVVLVTGATGFVGKVVMEKLLRCVPSIKKILVLVRPKKKVTPEERFVELLKSSLFETFRAMRPDFDAYARSKIEVVSGDLQKDRMGTEAEVWDFLTENVNVILHNAATILFDEPLEAALSNNTMGALGVLELAKQCKNLDCFVHCSTAYVNPSVVTPDLVKEEVYPTAAELTDDPEMLLEELLATDPRLLAKRLKKILGRFPNTYTFTKNLTEQMLLRRKGDVPVCVVRPSIVACTNDEPIRGWIDNVNASGSYYLMGSFGLLQYVWGKASNVGDLVPVDFVSNSIIVAAMYCSRCTDMPVFHCTTSHRNPIQWGKARDYMEAFTNNHPPPKALAPCDLHFMEHGWSYYPAYWLNQKIPATMYSLYARSPLGTASARKNAQQLEKVMSKSLLVAQTFRFFVQNEWTFTTTRLMKMFNALSPEDKRVFNFDPKSIDWYTYQRCMPWGLRHFVAGETNLVHPEQERFSKMYFDRRTFQITADVMWAYSTNSKGLLSPVAPQTVVDRTLHSERVKKVIQELSQEHGVPLEQLKNESRQIMDQMAGQLYSPVIRTMAYFFRKIYKNLYDAVIVDELGLKRMRDLRAAVGNKQIPLVIIPTHRSYIDFLMLSFLFFAYELPMPQIAAGDDFLDMMGVNWIFRHSGAFFLKRSFRHDRLYRAIFEEYVQQLLVSGFPVEFFLEGTRSRTGKNLPPKLGLLSIATEPYFQGKLDDLHILPVAIGYEKMVEEDSHARQLTGEPRGSFSTKAFLKASYERVLGASFGRINIQFAPPIVASEFVREVGSQWNEAEQFNPRDNAAHRGAVVRQLGSRVLHDFLSESVVMSTGVVAAIVLAYRHGVDKETLVERYSWVEQEIQKRGGRVDPLSRDMDGLSIVNRALRLLGGAVVERRSFVEPKIDSRESHRNYLQLGLYRNQLPHIFFAEGLILVAVEKGEYKKAQVLEDAEFLRVVLSVEFDTPGVDWPGTLATMEQRKLVEVNAGVVSVVANKASYFLCSLMFPFIDSNWVAALSLFSLQHNRLIGEELLVSQMQWFSEKLFFDNHIVHFEACSKESFRYAVAVLEKHFGALRSTDGKYQITEAFHSEEAVADLCNKIGRLKKNGRETPKDVRQLVWTYFPIHSRL